MHPPDSSLLIKVINTERRSLSQKAHRIKWWYQRFHRESTYRVFIFELSEYISTSVKPAVSNPGLPLARRVGLVDTSMGLGLLGEKDVGNDGQMAPTLRHLIREQGWNDCWEVHLNRFFHDLAERHVMFNDVGPQNIVLGRNAAGTEVLVSDRRLRYQAGDSGVCLEQAPEQPSPAAQGRGYVAAAQDPESQQWRRSDVGRLPAATSARYGRLLLAVHPRIVGARLLPAAQRVAGAVLRILGIHEPVRQRLIPACGYA